MIENIYQWRHHNVIHTEAENKIFELFSAAVKSLNEQGNEGSWTIERDVELIIHQLKGVLDILILRNNFPEAIVEIKSQIRDGIKDDILHQLKIYEEILHAKLVIACSTKDLMYSNVKDGKLTKYNEIPLYNENDILELLKEGRINLGPLVWNDVKNFFLSTVDLSSLKLDKIDRIKSYINGIKPEDISIKSEGRSFYIENNTNGSEFDFEDGLFQSIIGTVNSDLICRYTSLSSIFRTCNDKSQSMCSIVCMNDSTEPNYVLDRLSYNYNSLAVMKDANSCFISSCSEYENRDNLTMWRLYGDNAKGVCICYSVDYKKLSHFFLAPVCYEHKDGTFPELDYIGKLISNPVKGRYLVLNRLPIWQHFFKPKEYVDEKEIRLLYIDKANKAKGKVHKSKFQKKWIMDGTSHIIAPIITFSITDTKNEYPLVLKEVILGPKSPEKEQNRNQLGFIIEDNRIKVSIKNKLNVASLSSIKNYR